MTTPAPSVLTTLQALLEERKAANDANASYVASLHSKGLNKILEKIGEESTEVILAAKDAQATKNTAHLVSESADLLFHLMVLLSHLDTNLDATIDELEKRFDISGLVEKASRTES